MGVGTEDSKSEDEEERKLNKTGTNFASPKVSVQVKSNNNST